MRPYIALSVLSATLLAVSVPASANGPFTRPSVTAKATADAPPPLPAIADQAPSPESIQAAQEKALQEAKAKATEERRKRYNLAEGQDAVEVPYKGARVGTVNGVNVYRSSADNSSYYFEPVAQRKYVHLPTEETYTAPASVVAVVRTAPLAPGAKPGTPASTTAQLPSAVGRPAPTTTTTTASTPASSTTAKPATTTATKK